MRQLRKYNESGLWTGERRAAAAATPLPRICNPPFPPPPTCIRRNVAAVAAQMASIFVLLVAVALVDRHVCTCKRALAAAHSASCIGIFQRCRSRRLSESLVKSRTSVGSRATFVLRATFEPIIFARVTFRLVAPTRRSIRRWRLRRAARRLANADLVARPQTPADCFAN